MWQSPGPELPWRQLHRLLLHDRQLRLRLIIALTVLLLSFASTYLVGSRTIILFLIVAGAAGVVGLLILLRWPPLGLVLLSFSGMVAPGLGFNGLNTSMLLVGLMLGLWLLEMLVQGKVRLPESRALRPLVLLVIVSLIALAIGQFRWFTAADSAPLDAQVGGFSLVILSAGAFLLAADRFKDIRWLRAFTWLFIAAGGAYLLVRLLPPLRPLVGTVIQRGAFDSLFWTWLPAMAFSQALINRKLRPASRAVLLVVGGTLVYVALVQSLDWKSGWVPASVAIGVIIFLYSWRAGLFLLLGAGAVLAPFVPALLESDAYSLSTRVDAWLILYEIIKASPIFGLGFGNYRFYTPLFRIRGWTVAFNSHNNYIDIIAQMGLVGLACFLWFFAEVGLLGWRLRQRVPDGFARAYVYGALAGTVGTLVAGMLGDWIIPFVYNITLDGFRTSVIAWTFLGGLIALESVYNDGARGKRN